MGIGDHWSINLPGLCFEPSGLHSERPRLYFQPLKLLNFAFNADPDPIFPFITDSDPASKNNADSDLDPQLLAGKIPTFKDPFRTLLYRYLFSCHLVVLLAYGTALLKFKRSFL
jgi:hypothetical protein